MGANNSTPADYSTAAFAILGIHIGLTTVALVGRTVSRRLIKANLSTDDILTYIAYTANLGLLVSGLLLAAFGALNLKKILNLGPEKRHLARVAYSALAILYVVAMTFVKLSILFVYKRIFTLYKTWFRYMWWGLLNLTISWTATCIVLLALNGIGQMPSSEFSRLGISITGIVNAFSDILLLLLPTVMISGMKLQKKQKLALMSIFAVGILASVVSIVRSVIFFINRTNILNTAYSNYLDIVLTTTESSAGLICACLPLMKPVVVCFTHQIQRMRGLDTGHQGWTTVSTSQDSIGKTNRTITRVDDFDVQLVTITPVSASQLGEKRDTMAVDTRWQSVDPYERRVRCESMKPNRPSRSHTAAQWEA